VGRPAGVAGQRERRREQVRRQTDAHQDRRRVVLDVGFQRPVRMRSASSRARRPRPGVASSSHSGGCSMPRPPSGAPPPEGRSAIDAVAEAHQPLRDDRAHRSATFLAPPPSSNTPSTLHCPPTHALPPPRSARYLPASPRAAPHTPPRRPPPSAPPARPPPPPPPPHPRPPAPPSAHTSQRVPPFPRSHPPPDNDLAPRHPPPAGYPHPRAHPHPASSPLPDGRSSPPHPAPTAREGADTRARLRSTCIPHSAPDAHDCSAASDPRRPRRRPLPHATRPPTRPQPDRILAPPLELASSQRHAIHATEPSTASVAQHATFRPPLRGAHNVPWPRAIPAAQTHTALDRCPPPTRRPRRAPPPPRPPPVH
jgi:hypothetical protein